MGGSADTSGVSQSLLGTLLSWMQDKRVNGCIFVGPPGAAKSAVAKSAGNEAGAPTVEFDLGGMKKSLVGESEQNLRLALKTADAMAQGRILVIATCNHIAGLPPELRRRFALGTFYFDLPDKDEREAIWKIHTSRYGISNPQINFDDTGWTGAEIEQACKLSSLLDCSLDDASGYIVPVSIAAADKIAELQREATGKFISASYPGTYRGPSNALPVSQNNELLNESSAIRRFLKDD